MFAKMQSIAAGAGASLTGTAVPSSAFANPGHISSDVAKDKVMVAEWTKKAATIGDARDDSFGDLHVVGGLTAGSNAANRSYDKLRTDLDALSVTDGNKALQELLAQEAIKAQYEQMKGSFSVSARAETLDAASKETVADVNARALSTFNALGGTVPSLSYLVCSALPANQAVVFDDLVHFDRMTIRVQGGDKNGETMTLEKGFFALTEDAILVSYQHRLVDTGLSFGMLDMLAKGGCCTQACGCAQACGDQGLNCGTMLDWCRRPCCQGAERMTAAMVDVGTSIKENLRIFILHRKKIVSADYTSSIEASYQGRITGVFSDRQPSCADSVRRCCAQSCFGPCCFCECCKVREKHEGAWKKDMPVTAEPGKHKKVLTLGVAQGMLPGAVHASDFVCTLELAPFVHTYTVTQLMSAIHSTILA